MSQSDDKTTEISNVDLQFMGQTDVVRDQEAALEAESNTETPGAAGMDKQDIVVAHTMDASDPPSTNMGEDDQ